MQTETPADPRAVLAEGLLVPEQVALLSGPPLRDLGPGELAAELVERGWLTRFQARAVLEGRGPLLRLGNYLLIDRLGRGGMGEVFRARHLRLKRQVALKVIHPECVNKPGAAERFGREVRAAARLNHPNVVRVFDSDVADGLHYLAMEYVEGVDLGRLVKERGPLDAARSCELIRQASLGVQHAHENGLVHRDIKPGNLLVTADAGLELVKVLDFGLARFTAEDGPADHLTETGTVIGTPEFLAPEQARDSRSADARSDVFSLGCTLYFLLTADVPFPGTNVMEKLMARVSGEFTPLWMRRPDAPAGLEAIIARCLSPDPARRYQSPADLADALAPFAQGQAPDIPLAEPAPEDEEVGPSAVFAFARTSVAPKPPRSRRPLLRWATAGVGAALLFAVAIAVGILASGSGRPPDPDRSTDPEPPHGPAPAVWAIPEAERAPWQPPELLGVLGKQAGRPWRSPAALGISPDGRWLATISPAGDAGLPSFGGDTQVCLWEVPSLRPRRAWQVPGPTTDTPPVLAPGGRWLFIPGLGGQPGRLYDLKADPPRSVEGLPAAGASTGGFPDADTLVTLAVPNLVQFWDLRTGSARETARHRLESDRFHQGVLTADGRSLLVAGLQVGKAGEQTGSLRTFRLSKERATERVLLPPTRLASIAQAALAADGRVAALVYQATPEAPTKAIPRLLIWEAAGGEPTALLDPAPPLLALALSPDGRLLLARDTSEVRAWERVGSSWRELPDRPSGLTAGRLPVAFGTGTLYRAGPDQTLDVWALRDGRLRQTPGADPAAVTGLAWSADGSRLRALTRWPGGRCRLEAFDADTGLPAGPATEGVWHVEELHAGSGVLFACGSAALRWRDAPEKATRLRAFDDSSREIPAPAWNAAAAGLTAASAGQALAILDARGNLPVWAELAGNPNRFQPPGVLAAALSADGRRLLTAGAERIRAANWNGRELRWPDGTGVLSVWDVATDGRLPRLTERRRPTSVTSPVLCVAMAPDGSAGASGERDGLVRLWDLETGQERSQFSVRHEGGVAALAYSADGRLLASGGHDGRLVIASADSLRAIKEWQLPGPPIALRFDPSGRRLAVANGNGTAWVLAVP